MKAKSLDIRDFYHPSTGSIKHRIPGNILPGYLFEAVL